MSERKRRKIMMDWGRWQTVLKHIRKASQPSTVAVLVAMENVCFEQRSKHGGNAFVGSYPFLASMSGVHEDTVRNAVQLLEELDVIRVKQSYDARRKRYSENYYTLLLIGGGGGGGTIQGGVMESEATSESVALSKEKGVALKCPAADAASPLALRHFNATSKKDKAEALEKKAAAAARYKEGQAAAAAERKAQEEAAHAERMRQDAANAEERRRLYAERQKAEQEAAKRAEDARRLAIRSDVASCVFAIRASLFDEIASGTVASVSGAYDRPTFAAAVARLPTDLACEVELLQKNYPWEFDDAPEKLTRAVVTDHAADHGRDHVSDDPRSPSTV